MCPDTVDLLGVKRSACIKESSEDLALVYLRAAQPPTGALSEVSRVPPLIETPRSEIADVAQFLSRVDADGNSKRPAEV